MSRWFLVVPMAALAVGVGHALAVDSSSAATNACATGYRPCLPIRNDLDCSQIDDALKPVRVTGADQYGLDRDRDGLGCEVSGEGGGSRSPWGLILRRPPRKEATSAKVGDTLTVVGWSPRRFRGEDFQLCVTRTSGSACVDSNRYVLKGTVRRSAHGRSPVAKDAETSSSSL